MHSPIPLRENEVSRKLLDNINALKSGVMPGGSMMNGGEESNGGAKQVFIPRFLIDIQAGID